MMKMITYWTIKEFLKGLIFITVARAERRLGEMLKEQPKATGGQHGGKTSLDGSRKEPSNKQPTLDDLGIDKKLSSRAKQLADIPEDVFEQTLAEHREEQAAVTSRTMTRLAEQADTDSKKNGNGKKSQPIFCDRYVD